MHFLRRSCKKKKSGSADIAELETLEEEYNRLTGLKQQKEKLEKETKELKKEIKDMLFSVEMEEKENVYNTLREPDELEIHFCPYCGTLAEGAVYCPKCGNRIRGYKKYEKRFLEKDC